MIRIALLHSHPIQGVRDYKSTNYSHKLHKKRQDFSKFPKKNTFRAQISIGFFIFAVNFARLNNLTANEILHQRIFA